MDLQLCYLAVELLYLGARGRLQFGHLNFNYNLGDSEALDLVVPFIHGDSETFEVISYGAKQGFLLQVIAADLVDACRSVAAHLPQRYSWTCFHAITVVSLSLHALEGAR